MSKFGNSVRRPFDQAINEALARLNKLDEANGRRHEINLEGKVLTPDEEDILKNNWDKQDVKKNTKYYCRMEYILLQGEKRYLIYEKTYELNNRIEYENDFMWVPELYTGLLVDCLSAYALVAKHVHDENVKNEEAIRGVRQEVVEQGAAITNDTPLIQTLENVSDLRGI